ncbi:MAG: SPOR domain-containing protein [Elstera sp.]
MQQDFDPRDLEPALPSEEPKGRRWLPATIALVALGGFSGIVWYAYNQGASTSNGGAVPLVQADAGPLKSRPTDPGGLEVPNQDKLILNGQAVDGAPGKVERMLPPPEAPIAKPALAATPTPPPAQPQIATATPPALTGARPQAPAAQQTSPILVPNQQQANAVPRAVPQTSPQGTPVPQPVVSRPAPVPQAPAVQAPAPVAAKPPAVQPAPAATPAAAGTTRGAKVQLGAVKSEAAASAEWAKMQKANPELANLSMSVAKVEIPNKGTYYRIQAGPVADGGSVCAALKARGQDCLIVR